MCVCVCVCLCVCVSVCLCVSACVSVCLWLLMGSACWYLRGVIKEGGLVTVGSSNLLCNRGELGEGVNELDVLVVWISCNVVQLLHICTSNACVVFECVSVSV